MRKMKDSGIAWIGKIPEEWGIIKIKYISIIVSGDAIRSEELNFDGKYEAWGANGKIGLTDRFNTSGDRIIIGRVGACGTVNKSHNDIFVSDNALVLECITGDFNYIFYALLSANLPSLNTSNAQPLITATKVNNVFIPNIDKNEQHSISQYLDAKCAEIEVIAADIRATIEKFNEYKQTVITRAVTRGLDPTEPVKNSGVPWIGEISVNWELRKLKSITYIISKGTTPSTVGQEIVSSGDIRFIKAENIYRGTVNLTPEFYITKETDDMLARSRLFDNDILFVIAGATIGKTAIIKNDCLPANTNQAVAFIRLKENENHKYIQYYLQSSCVTEILNITSVQSAQPNLSLSNLGNFYIPYPPITYQKTISDYLDARCAEIDEAIAQQETRLAMLEAYKKSLIYECVTGKREVPTP